jgi:hypothetical protein
MLLNALNGEYEFKPDYAVFSDTGCEPQYVYDYLEWLIDYVKAKYNFEIKTVSHGNLMDDVAYYIDGKRPRASQLPFHLGRGGLIMRQCTADYKINPLRKYLQQIRNHKRIRLWIGISLDEIERMSNSNVKYIEHYYPLIENRISIDTIKNWYSQNGLLEPGKSACLICPFHSNNYWTLFKKQFPTEFQKACDFDDKIRNYPKLKHSAYLSSQRIPLRDIDFTQEASLFPELIEECQGLCGL